MIRVNAQTAWIEPDPTDVTQKIRIYVDLNRLDKGLEHNQLLIDNPGPFYIWTWKPFEHPTGTPKANGEGEKPWKNSNELLKMTKDDTKGEKVYYYEMTPTEFYEVSAAKVYADGISFLLKPKDGGGYGDPDVKSNDFNLTVTPPKTDKGTLYPFPSVLLGNHITTITYDNTLEKKVSMQNLADGDAYLYLKATIKDTASGLLKTIEPSKFLMVQDNPQLEMKKSADGKFRLRMVPDRFFNVPAGHVLTEIEMIVRKKNWNSVADQIAETVKYKCGCK
jgi:hypothetical protein